MAAEITSAGARHVVLHDPRRLAARPHRLPPTRGRVMSFASPIGPARPVARAAGGRGLRLVPATSGKRRSRPSSSRRCCRTWSTGCRAGAGICPWRSCCSPSPASCSASPGRTPRSRCAPRKRPSSSRSTRRARWARTTSARRGSPPRRPRPGASSRELPEKYRVAVVAFSSRAQLVAPPTQNRVYVASALELAARRRRARRSATRSRPRSRSPWRRRRAQKRPAGKPPPPTAILVLSDGAQDGGSVKLADAVAPGAQGEGARLHGAAGHGRRASCRCRTSAATSSASRCRPIPQRSAPVAAQTGGSYFAAPTQDDLTPGLRRSEVAPRQDEQGRGDHRRLRGRRCALPARRGRPLGRVVPEGPVIRAAADRRSRVAAALVAGVPASQAADECRGLQVCIPVAGPWVVIPGPGRTVRDGDLAARLPAGRRRRRRRPGQRDGRRRGVPGTHRQPGQPGHHDHGLAALQGHLRRPRPQGRRAISRSSAAFPAEAAGRARRRRSRARAGQAG